MDLYTYLQGIYMNCAQQRGKTKQKPNPWWLENWDHADSQANEHPYTRAHRHMHAHAHTLHTSGDLKSVNKNMFLRVTPPFLT